jgi:predicted PurR-regulated permease PerM
MIEELNKQLSSIKILIRLFIIAVGIYIFQNISQVLNNFYDIFAMLVFAWLISFILEPIVEKLSKFTRMSKIFAAIIVYLLFLALVGVIIFLFIPIVISQLQTLMRILPNYLSPYPAFINKWGDIISSSLNNSLNYIPSVASILFSMFLVLIISFYFVIDKVRINNELFHLIPKKWHKEVRFTQNLINTTFASFLRVQLLFGIITGIMTWIILRVFAIDYAASTSLLAGILTMIPLIGGLLGIIPPVLVAFLIDPLHAIYVAIFLIIGQQIEFNIIGPKLLGNALRLHPVIVILSFVVGYKVAGNVGAIFAIPFIGILIVAIHRLSSHFINPETTS